MDWRLHFSDYTPRVALFSSKLPHCLYDLLARWRTGEFRAEIPLIISNHDDHADIAREFGIAFHHLPVTKETKAKSREPSSYSKKRESIRRPSRATAGLGEVTSALSGGSHIHHLFAALPAQAIPPRIWSGVRSWSHRAIRARSWTRTDIEQDVARSATRCLDVRAQRPRPSRDCPRPRRRSHLRNRSSLRQQTVVFD